MTYLWACLQRDGLLQKSYLNAYEKTLAGNPFSAKNREAQIEGALFNTEDSRHYAANFASICKI